MYWNSLNDRLREQYGTKVYKLALSSGCSCPRQSGRVATERATTSSPSMAAENRASSRPMSP